MYRARARRFLAADPGRKQMEEALRTFAARAEQPGFDRASDDMADSDVEAAARAICDADPLAPEADAPIYIGVRAARAWHARVPMARAAIATDPGRARLSESLRELSTVTAACLRIMAEAGLGARLQSDLERLGIKDGFGVRARAALDGGTNG